MGIFSQPDTIMPNGGDPRALNRFSYAYNNPLAYIDPSGHDPFDAQWEDEFWERHRRPPEWYDYSIRLFSLAFPDEWSQETWSKFYTSNGKIRDGGAAIETVYYGPGQARNWGNMGRALANLESYYLPGEEGYFVRDVGLLFAGLYGRKEVTSAAEAAWVGQKHTPVWLYADETLGPDWAGTHGTDVGGANGPHWAWSFVLGYAAGQEGGFVGNIAHEVQNMWENRSLRFNMADLRIGSAGAAMGAGLRARSNGLRLGRLEAALRVYVPIQ